MGILFLTFIVVLALQFTAFNNDVQKAKKNGKELSKEEIAARINTIWTIGYFFAFLATVMLILGF